MKITIDSTTSIKDVKKAFNEQYNELRIDFFIDQNNDGNYTHDEKVVSFEKKLVDIATKRPSDERIEVDFSGSVTVGDLEEVFEKNWGLIAQVFRKRGNSWLMTSSTDHFTLDALQKQSEASATAPEQRIIDASDRRELE